MAIYMNFNDLAIKGNVTAEGYADWINIQSLQYGIGRGISMEAGNVANREASRPSISELSISKMMDTSSAKLLNESVTGAAGIKVVIEIVKTGAKQLDKFCTIELENVLVSGYSVSSGGEGAPSESISLSFTKIQYEYVSGAVDNADATTMKVGYDLVTGKPL
ncbi:MAG: type VI secretion system secreted protein Hcp [Oceanicoccus sp.]|jgi:type VI secretion system secreted protein Hcp